MVKEALGAGEEVENGVGRRKVAEGGGEGLH